MRAASLSSYSGHAALPGGRADASETAIQTARREAEEEIGLPIDAKKFPHPFRVEHLCELPANLARTVLVVRPCVAFLHSYDEDTGSDIPVDEALMPRLDAKEVAAVFSAPFHNFLLAHDEASDSDPQLPGTPNDWYRGSWANWQAARWRWHYFHVPITNQRVTMPKRSEKQRIAAEQLAKNDRFQVWGMTARIIVDAATLAYGHQPEFEHNAHFGDEKLIDGLQKMGRFTDTLGSSDELTNDDMKKAASL